MGVNLVRTAIRLKFAEALRPWLEVRELFRVASGDESIELKGDVTYFEDSEKKQRVGFQFRAVSFELEADATTESVRQNALNMFTDLNTASPLPAIEQTRIDSVFIAPQVIPFSDLRSLMRQAYLRPTQLAERASDIGINLEQDEGHVLKHIKIGPMERSQLQESYLHFSKDAIPDHFVFIGLTFQWNVEMGFNSQELHTVIEEAQAWQESAIQHVLADVSRAAGG